MSDFFFKKWEKDLDPSRTVNRVATDLENRENRESHENGNFEMIMENFEKSGKNTKKIWNFAAR